MGCVLDEIKAITLWQPWAQLCAIRAKKFETRGWSTKYRGLIAIHAAKKPPIWTVTHIFDGLPKKTLQAMGDAMGVMPGRIGLPHMFDMLPLGEVIATADLVEVWQITASGDDWADMQSMSDPMIGQTIQGVPNEIAFGDWSPGRYAWQLENVRMLARSVPVKGAQGLWTWRDHA